MKLTIPRVSMMRRPGPWRPGWNAPQTGAWGEAWAAWHYYHKRGAAILYRNWTDGRNEIDLVMRERGTLVFCEVKTRQPFEPEPLSAVRDPRRITHLRAAAISYYRALVPPRPPVRFDALLVTPDAANPRKPQIDCLENVLSADGLL